MEDTTNQWSRYDHDPLLLTDVSLQQESFSYTRGSNCKKEPFNFSHSFSFFLSLSCGNSQKKKKVIAISTAKF